MGIERTIVGALWTTTMQREIPAAVLSRRCVRLVRSPVSLPVDMAPVGPAQQLHGMTATIVGAATL